MRTHRPPLFYRARPVPPVPNLIPGRAPIGVNFAQIAPGSLINILRGRNPAQPIGGGYGSRAPVDASGDPTTDFQFYPGGQAAYSGAPRALKGRFDGYATIVLGNTTRFTLANQAYNSGTNQTTFDFVDNGGPLSDNPALTFSNTRRGGPSGAANTGVRNLMICEAGYTPADLDAGRVWTDATLAFHGHFAAFRFMDSQPTTNGFSSGINNDLTGAWPGPSITSAEQASFAELVKLCNLTGADAWFCVGVNWSDASISAMAAWLDAALDPARHVHIELGNELWNLAAFSPAGTQLTKACVETKSFIGGTYRRWTESRAGGVVTITTVDQNGTQIPHGWVNGQTIWTAGVFSNSGSPATGYGQTFTLASIPTSSSATFAFAGDDVATRTNGDSGSFIIGDLSTNLTPGAQFMSIYKIGERYNFRRLVQISDLFRAVVGDAKMGTRVRIVYADQAGASFDPNLWEYVRTTFPARAVGQGLAGASGAYFYGHAGAPYYSSQLNGPGITIAQCCDDLSGAAARAKWDYHFDIRLMVAATYGLKSLWYEGGPDTSAIVNSGSLSAADQTVRAAAQYDLRAGTAVRTILTDWFSAGGDLVMWYHNGLGSPTDNQGGYAWGELATSLADVAAPKMAAFIGLQSSGVPVTRNVLSSTLGVPTVLDQTTRDGAYGGTTGPGPYDDMRFNVSVAEAGTYSLSFVYSAAGNPITVRVLNGLAQAGGDFAMTMNGGTFPDHSTTHTSPTFTLQLKAGVNMINVRNTQSASGYPVLFYRAFTFTRTA